MFGIFTEMSIEYSYTALLLPIVLVNIIVIVMYFYPRLRIRYPES